MKTTNTISGSQPAEVNYRSIFEHAVEGIFQSTPEGRFLAVNPALARILGFASPEELLTQRTDIARQGYVRPEDRDEFKRLLAADGSVGGFEYESYRKDGSRLWLSESARAVRDAAGQVICYEGTIEDITARKQAESALAAAADLFERTSAMAKVGGWELDLRTLKVSWTLETCRIHEVDPPVAPVLEAAINFYAPEARPVIQAAVQAGMDHGTPWDLELPLITAKGRRIWVRAQGSAVFEDGKAVKLHGAFQDITQRKQAEAEARANEQRFRALIEHGHDGIVLFAADGSVLYASPSTTNVLGYLTEDIRQHNALEYVHHEWQDAVREQMAESLRRPGVAVLSQGYVRHKDGQWRFLEGTFTNLLHEPGVGAIVCNFRDLTERRLAKQRLAAFAKLGRQLNATYQADEAARTILGVADELLGYDCCTLALYDATTDLCSSLMTVDVLNGQRQEVPSVYENAPPSPRMRRAIAQGAELVLREEPLAFAPGEIPFGDTSRPSASLMIAPLRDGVQVIGVLSIQSYTLDAYTEDDLATLQALADHCGGALARIRARAEQEREHELLRTLIDNLPPYIFVKDAAGRYLVSNRAHSEFLGVADEIELLGKTVFDFFPPETARAYAADDEVLMRTGEPVVDREELRETVGRRHWYSLTKLPLRDLAGGITGLIGIKQDISQRKLAEEEVRASEQRFSGLVRNLEGIVWEADAQTFQFRYVSEFAEKLLGHPVSRWFEPSFWRDHIHPEDRDRAVNYCVACTARGETHDFEYRMIASDGRAVWFRDLVTVEMADGKPHTLRGVMVDITERKLAEDALRASEEKFQNLFESSPDAIIVATRAGVIHTINRQAELMFGYTRAELVGQAIENLMPAALRRGHDKLREGYVRNPHVRPMGDCRDLFARRKDGSEFPVDISLSPMTTSEGMMVISTIRDVTKRKQAEEQVRLAEAKYRMIFDNTVEGIVQTDPSGRIITANPTMARLLGYDTPEQLLAASLNMERDVYANTGDRTSLLRRARTAGRDFIQCRFKRRDGQLIWVALNVRVVQDAKGEPQLFEGTCVDITERRQLEDQLRESQKMEAIGQLAGGIAHDFNNILGAILGNAELVKVMPAGSREAGECLDSIVTASRRAGDLVQQILAFSRRQEQKRQPLQLHLIVREALKLLRATVPAAIEFKTSVAISPTVLADPSQIHSVTMNLCTNAWHAMKDRPGTLTVELAETEVDEPFARVHPDLRPGRYVRLSVTDTGAGMDAATLQHIFEPFFTTKPVGEGTGLGLAVVHGIVKNHDGGIVVHSKPGRGSTFALYFPVFEAEVVEAPAAPQPIPRGTGQQILFVDDEEPLARLGAAALGRLNYRVTTRTSPVEALALFSEKPAQFDLVVTDLNMPGLSGTEFARKLLAIRPDARIILATGYSATITADVARELGFSALLPKPYDLRSLGETVQRVVTRPAHARHA